MEIFICKQGLVEDYNQSVIEYKNKGRKKYDSQMIEKYFSVLGKIESLLSNPKFKQDHRINEEKRTGIENSRR